MKGEAAQRQERFGRADHVIRIGFWINAVLMAMKLAAGYFGRSEAVFADGIESACDFIAIASTMLALRIGRKPYDETHPYGHGRAEHIAAILISFVIFASGAWILIKAIHTILDGHYNGPQFIAVAAAVVTVLIKGWLSRYTTEVGKNLDSPAILAVAKDHRKDAVTSIATVIGVGGAYLGIRIMDPIAAGLTSFFIFHIGYGTFMDAAHDLMDGRPPRELIASITKLAEKVEGVEGVHEIRARRSGQFLIVDLKLDMDPSMTVKRSHAIATEVKKLIFDRVPNVGDVMIHVNPYNEDHEDLTRL